jgi:hypothetical protein
MTIELFFQGLGFVGAIIALLAYTGVSFRGWQPNSVKYQGLNLLTGIMIGASCLYFNALGSVLLNVVWAIIAAVKLYQR